MYAPISAPKLIALVGEYTGLCWNQYKQKTRYYAGLVDLLGILRNLNWSGMEDLNLRPLRPERSALPDCANARILKPGGLAARRATITKGPV
jgi:hypothetical protein